jgi:putative nucleotidyltransferase with HDIG domain
MDQSKSKKVDLILQQLNGLPTLPAVAARLLQLTVQSDTHADEVVKLIECDPALASKIISLSTQASKDINRQVPTSVGKAVMLLGFESVRNAVLSIKVFETLGGDAEEREGEFDRTEFWKHSLAVACAARRIIAMIDEKADPEEAFMCGLLHDMGKVALDTCLPKSYARVVEITAGSMGNISDIERKILGIDHSTAGKRLAERWNLPPTIIESIWLHHQHPQCLPDSVSGQSLIQSVYLADLLVREQRIGYSGNFQISVSALSVSETLGITRDAFDTLCRELRPEISERSFMLGLDDINPEDLYQEALGRANSELGNLNQRLHQQNSKLANRSKYLDLLSELSLQLVAGQTVAQVCAVIAELWQTHMRSVQCGVFMRSEDQSLVEGAVKPREESLEFFLVDGEVGLQVDRAPEFAIKNADREFNWFFENISTEFDIDLTWTMPLLIGGRAIGGVIWQMSQVETHYYRELQEMQAFAASCALALCQAQLLEKESSLCEQLVQNNHLLQETRHELVEKKSLATVGEMASGAAHEINNPLAVIVGRAEWLASSEGDVDRRETLEKIAESGQEITTIVKELMLFADPPAPVLHAISVHEILTRSVTDQSENAKRECVELKVVLDEQLPDVFVDKDQISAAIGELLANSIASYEGQGGSICLSAFSDLSNNEVVLDVQDNGCGIDRTFMERVFTPFFSGKTAGRNRGLGLSRSLRQIEGNGGKLRLQSTVGEGTTARIVLPVAQVPVVDEAMV